MEPEPVLETVGLSTGERKSLITMVNQLARTVLPLFKASFLSFKRPCSGSLSTSQPESIAGEFANNSKAGAYPKSGLFRFVLTTGLLGFANCGLILTRLWFPGKLMKQSA